jgi:branched-chain amino acid transport system substrate-binding protein
METNMQFRPLSLATALFCALGFSAVNAQDAWVVGQSAPLTGSNAAFGKDIRDGALAYFKMVNARGGVAGKPVELVTLDDANDRKTAGANTQKLLSGNGAVALMGYASATLSLDAMPLADKAGVLFFAPFSGAVPVRQGPPVVFTLRASYADELEKMLAFWTGVGARQVVVVHYDDEVGKQNLAVVTEYLKKQGKTPMAYSLQRNAKIDAGNVTQLLALKPDVLINTVLSGPAAEISKQLASRGAMVPTSSLSFVGAQQFIQAAGESAAGVSIGQVVPNPSARLPIVTECARALQESGVTQAMNSTHLEACIAAKVLTEAMRRSKKAGDNRGLISAMRSMDRYDTGGFVVSYGPGQNHGSKFVELAMVTRDGKLRN